MYEFIDVQKKAKTLLTQGRLVESEGFDFADGVFQAENSDAVVEGDILAGGVARGLRALIVQGNVIGSAQQPCRLSFGGDVIVVGCVEHAQIVGLNVYVNGNVSHSHVFARVHAQMGGIVTDSTFSLGGVSTEQKQVNLLSEQIRMLQDKFHLVKQQLAVEERRVEKLIKSTQFHIEFGTGGLVVRGRTSVRVNLKMFYGALKSRSEKDIDRALVEFFNRAVVGLLTQKNRHLIQDNVNRRKIFMGLIKNLHSLFIKTRQRDQLKERLDRYEKRVAMIYEAIASRQPVLFFQSEMKPPVTCTFIQPKVEKDDAGERLILADEVKLSINNESPHTVLIPGASDDLPVPTAFAQEQLACGCLYVDAGQVKYETLSNPTLA